MAGARFQCGDTICDGKIANGPTSTLTRRRVNILTPSKRKVIISIFHNLEKMPVRRTGAYRHKKSTDPTTTIITTIIIIITQLLLLAARPQRGINNLSRLTVRPLVY